MRTMTKTLAVVFAVMVQSTISCSAETTSSSMLGVSLPMTGPLAVYGVAVKNGFELAAEEFGSGRLPYKIDDNRFQPAEAVTSLNRLLTLQRATAIFVWGEVVLGAIAEIVERQKIPTYALSVDPRPAKGKRSIIRTVNTPDELVAPLAKHFSGARKIVIVATDDLYMESLGEAWRRAGAVSGTEVEILHPVSPEETDFRTIVSKLKMSKADVIGVNLLPGQVRSFFHQATVQKLTGPFFGTDCFESREEIAQGGAAMEGAVYANLVVPDEFRQKYLTRYNTEDQISYAYNGYVTAKYLFSGEKGAGVLADAQVEFAMTEAGERYFRFPVEVREVKGGWFVKRARQ